MSEMDCAVRTSWCFCTSSVDVRPGTQLAHFAKVSVGLKIGQEM
jgi:hypothetical protein